MQICFLRVALALTTLAGLVTPADAGIVFGSNGDDFTMEFVTIGNPGNAADTDHLAQPLNAGAVGYTYGIGKFEVSRDMITKYNATPGVVAITLADMTSYGGNGANKPATGVSWNEAARFVNWLNTSTGNQAAYNFTTTGSNDDIELWQSNQAGYDASNPYRNSLAKYVLPSYNEWYKAAYYDPNKMGGAGYWDYANGKDTAPTAVASGTGDNTAVYDISPYTDGPADVNEAGGLSPYGVMGLGGNVFEWEESSFDLTNTNSSGTLERGYRGGVWYNGSIHLSSQYRYGDISPNYEDAYWVGFRVVSLAQSGPPAVPEPSMMVIGMLFGLGGFMAKRRMKK